jgi:hypothetical protein
MSLLSSFLASHLIPALESAFLAHAPEAQQMLINELDALAKQVSDWVATKVTKAPAGE